MAFERTKNFFNKTLKFNDSSMQKSKSYVTTAPFLNEDIHRFLAIQQDSGGDLFSVLTDPTNLGFKLFFHFSSQSGLLASETYTNSALAYLARIGDMTRYNLLKRFISVLSMVNSISPWVFQSIDGLGEIYKKPFDEMTYSKSLTISCLETIDFRISALNDVWRRIVWDSHRKIYILPENLRQFSMSVYVYDTALRMASVPSNNSTSINSYNFMNHAILEPSPSLNDNSNQLVNSNSDYKISSVAEINHVLFDIGYCTFSIDSGSSTFTTVSNADQSQAVQDLIIDFRQSEVSGLFKTLFGESELAKTAEAFVKTSVSSQGVPQFDPTRNLLQTARDFSKSMLDLDSWKTKIDDFADIASVRLLDKAYASLHSLYLGNVHGFEPAALSRMMQSKEASEAFARTYMHINGNQSLGNIL